MTRPIDTLIAEARGSFSRDVIANCNLLTELADALERLQGLWDLDRTAKEHFQAEVKLARERLGPAGWKMIQELRDFRADLEKERRVYVNESIKGCGKEVDMLKAEVAKLTESLMRSVPLRSNSASVASRPSLSSRNTKYAPMIRLE